MPEIYLDNSATTRPLEAANAAYIHAATEVYGNPSSLHKIGFYAEQLVESSRKTIAESLGCDKSELLFTSGATESNNSAIKGAAAAYPRRGKRIVTTVIEHPSVSEPIAALEKQGYEIIRLSPDERGEYSAEQFAEVVNSDTLLVSVMWVNNEVGLIQPIAEIAKAVKRKNPDVLVHIDAVQGFLKLPLKLSATEIDLLAVSGHKVYAPKGIGALYIKKGVRLAPIIEGGGQQNNLRSGTEPVPAIAAFGAAAGEQKNEINERKIRYEELKKYLTGRLDDERITINCKNNPTAPHIVSASIKGIRSEIMLHFLEEREIYVSSGSACKKGKQSAVLAGLGISAEIADNTIRISFGRDTDEKKLDELVSGIFDGLDRLAKKR